MRKILFMRKPISSLRVGVGVLCQVVLLCLLCTAASVARSELTVPPLSASSKSEELWPRVTILEEREGALKIDQIVKREAEFAKPLGAYATLGARSAAVWLRIPLTRTPEAPERWVVNIDYAPLQKVDGYLMRDGVNVSQFELGSLRPFATRPLQARSHAAPVVLDANTPYSLYLRVETAGAYVLPITLNTEDAFHSRQLREQMLQGVLLGLGFTLLIYSLIQWIGLREILFGKYALLMSGVLLFWMLQFGTGSQFFWTDWFAFERRAAGISSLMASCGSFLFIEQILSLNRESRWLSRAMKLCAALCVVLAVVYCLDFFSTKVLIAIIGTFGILPAMLGIPIAAKRSLQRDWTALALLAAWVVYLGTTAVVTGTIRGSVDVNFWTLHSFQFGAAFDMLAFMVVLGQRTKAVRLAAQRARMERDLMRSLALSDPLTGLANRRGLMEALDATISASTPMHATAVYMIDVDGFKPVNDRYGHDVGDSLLVQIGRRLNQSVRGSDFVARLGGDEFVIVARDVPHEKGAQDLAQKVLQAVSEPFTLNGVSISVGCTVGYAIAPEDGDNTRSVLQAADAAMYQGKVSGKRCVRRAPGPSLAVATGD